MFFENPWYLTYSLSFEKNKTHRRICDPLFSMSMNFSDLSGHIVSKVQFTTFLEGRTVWYGASNEALRQRATVRVKPVHGVVGVVTVLATVRPVSGVGAAASGGTPGVRPPDTLTFKVRLTDWLPTVLHPCCRAALAAASSTASLFCPPPPLKLRQICPPTPTARAPPPARAMSSQPPYSPKGGKF